MNHGTRGTTRKAERMKRVSRKGAKTQRPNPSTSLRAGAQRPTSNCGKAMRVREADLTRMMGAMDLHAGLVREILSTVRRAWVAFDSGVGDSERIIDGFVLDNLAELSALHSEMFKRRKR